MCATPFGLWHLHEHLNRDNSIQHPGLLRFSLAVVRSNRLPGRARKSGPHGCSARDFAFDMDHDDMVEQPAVRRRLRRFAKDVISFREAMIGGDFHVDDKQRSQGMDSGLPGEPCIPLEPEQEFDRQALKHVEGVVRQVWSARFPG